MVLGGTLTLNLITLRTNSAAGRACNPSLLTISTSLRMQLKVEARAKLVARVKRPVSGLFLEQLLPVLAVGIHVLLCHERQRIYQLNLWRSLVVDDLVKENID